MFEVIRVKKNKNYTTICNHHLRNPRLSLKAKGLMTVMLSLPNDTWELSIAGLAELCKDGKGAISSALKELEEEGYYSKRAEREKGVIVGWVHTLTEFPQEHFAPEPKNPDVANPDMDNPDMENPYLVYPDMGNVDQLNTKESITKKSNTQELSTNKYSTKRFVPPSLAEVQAYCNERGNNIDAEHFIAYYETRDWMVSGRKMKNWKSAVITWEKNGYSNKRTGNTYIDRIDNRVNVVDTWLEQAKREGLC